MTGNLPMVGYPGVPRVALGASDEGETLARVGGKLEVEKTDTIGNAKQKLRNLSWENEAGLSLDADTYRAHNE